MRYHCKPSSDMKDNPFKGRSPAFQLYADDFIAGTADMTAEEVGGFIRLLCHQWTHGGIPADQDRAARIAGLMGSPCFGYVLAKFSLSVGHTLQHPRLERIREEQQAFRAKQAAAGLNGAKKRWKKWPDDGDPNGQTMATPLAKAWPDDGSPSPSPINKIQADKPPSARFQKPSVEQLHIEAARIGLPAIEVDKFWNYYESNGWRVGKNPMKSWPAALRNWWARLKERPDAIGSRGAEKQAIDWRDSL